MQEQITQLTSEITKRKAKEMGDEQISSANIQEATVQTIPTPATTFSSRKHRLIPRNDAFQHRKIQKILQVTSAEKKGITESNLQEVIHLIQNTMQRLIAFETFCIAP